MLPLLLMLQNAPNAAPIRLDLRNWHSEETVGSDKRSCTFSLSPNFYGIVVRYAESSDDFEMSFDSPGVHVLPAEIAIPLRVIINDVSRQVSGLRRDRKLSFHLDRAMVETGMARRGMIRILLNAPSTPETLIARYRLSGEDYEGAATRFRNCSIALHDRSKVALASGR